MAKRIQIPIIVEIPNKDIETILDLMIKGVNHWCDCIEMAKPLCGATMKDHFICGGEFALHDKITDRTRRFSYGCFEDGVKEYIKYPADGDILMLDGHNLRLDITAVNERVVDDIIQYALFDKVKYRNGIMIS